MGNTSKKLAAKCSLLTRDEQKYVAATFRAASKNSDKIREEDLIKFWGPQIDPRLAQYLSNFLFGWGPQKSTTVEFNRFAELYVYNVRGSVDERLMVLCYSLGKEFNNTVELPYQLLKEYCESLASTFIKAVKGDCARPWLGKGFGARAACVQALGEAAAAPLAGDGDTTTMHCDAEKLSKWLQNEALLKHLTELVYGTLYGVYQKQGDDGPAVQQMPSLLPVPEGLDVMPDYPAFIDLAHIVWLNTLIPQEHRHKWRFLFSSHIHGESFITMSGRILDQGGSILIIEDDSGCIFGGYAPEPWTLGPNFAGNEDSFVFTLAPKMRAYTVTGFNNHYQYLNNHTKTLPNGLLMGGQFGFGAIWIPADPYGEGSSAESCTTYRGYKRLSRDPTFKIKSLEVWGVGDKPSADKESDERDVSILDSNTEAKAILELAGKTRHSEGIREPEGL